MTEWQKTICIDLDGTLAEYHGWTGEFEAIGDPLPGAWEFCQALRNAGWRIIIHTCRGDIGAIEQWLDEHGIAHDGINCTEHNADGSSSKPIADVYLDDRAVRFYGDFTKALERIEQAEWQGPWWEQATNGTASSPPSPLSLSPQTTRGKRERGSNGDGGGGGEVGDQ